MSRLSNSWILLAHSVLLPFRDLWLNAAVFFTFPLAHVLSLCLPQFCPSNPHLQQKKTSFSYWQTFFLIDSLSFSAETRRRKKNSIRTARSKSTPLIERMIIAHMKKSSRRLTFFSPLLLTFWNEQLMFETFNNNVEIDLKKKRQRKKCQRRIRAWKSVQCFTCARN